MAIIVAAMGVIAAATLPASEGNDINAKYLLTKKRMQKIDTAFLSMIATQGRRPCPASGLYQQGEANFGIEGGSQGNCTDGTDATGLLSPFDNTNIVGGTVPTKALNIPNELAYDGWGRPFTYVVDKRSTKAGLNQLLLRGEIRIDNAAGTQVDQTMYALISHGPDGHGAFLTQGSTAANRFDTGGTDADQLKNLGGAFSSPFTNRFVKREVQPRGGYDDLVWYSDRWKNTSCLGTICKEFPSFTGFRLNGNGANANAGWSVATGNINNDEYDDVIIGGDGPGVYVFFGSASGIKTPRDLSAVDGTNGFRFDTATTGGFGRAVASGDINGDGFDDVIVGAATSIYSGNNQAGITWVLFGKADWSATPTVTRADISGSNGALGFSLGGEAAADNSGTSIASGNIDGDSYEDVIIGAPSAGSGAGKVYVYFGKASFVGSVDIPLSGIVAATGFRLDGVTAGDLAGASIATGFVDSGTKADIVIGAPGADNNILADSGSIYLVFGQTAGTIATPTSLSTLNGTTGARYDGVAAGDNVGIAVARGDVNADGYQDMMIGATGADNNSASNSGSAYVVFGKNSGWSATTSLSTLTGSAATGFRIDGFEAGSALPTALAAGDMNDDGADEIIIGAKDQTSSAGAVYVVLGKPTPAAWNASYHLDHGISAFLNGTNAFYFTGVAASDYAGTSVSAGDITGDGKADVIVGAYGTDYNASSSGSVYGVYGLGSGYSTTYDLDDVTVP